MVNRSFAVSVDERGEEEETSLLIHHCLANVAVDCVELTPETAALLPR